MCTHRSATRTRFFLFYNISHPPPTAQSQLFLENGPVQQGCSHGCSFESRQCQNFHASTDKAGPSARLVKAHVLLCHPVTVCCNGCKGWPLIVAAVLSAYRCYTLNGIHTPCCSLDNDIGYLSSEHFTHDSPANCRQRGRHHSNILLKLVRMTPPA